MKNVLLIPVAIVMFENEREPRPDVNVSVTLHSNSTFDECLHELAG